MHRRFAGLHTAGRWLGAPDSFGTATAILLGDLCLVWSDEMLHGSGLDPVTLARARRTFDDMRTEVTVGQYLDVQTQATGDTSTDRASLVAHTHALDRVLQYGFYVIPNFHLSAFWVAYWDKFRRPEISPKYGIGLDTWWVDPKAEQTIEAKKGEVTK